MATSKQKPELIVIVGPTASGKSELAMRIARQFNGEIICADSRTVYRRMDIGTAKPTKKDQAEIRHWGLDIADINDEFTVKQFKDYALSAITDIKKRGKLPILVGGTGLYIDAVLFNFEFRPKADSETRKTLEAKTVSELQQQIGELGYEMPTNSQNKRHLIRTIESEGARGYADIAPRAGSLIVGINPAMEILEERINHRAKEIFEAGVMHETEELLRTYGRDSLLKTAGIIYTICLDLIDGKIDSQIALDRFKIADRQYAKRQLTWFKRNPYILWNSDIDLAEQTIKSLLNN